MNKGLEPWLMGFLIQKMEYGEVLWTVTHGFQCKQAISPLVEDLQHIYLINLKIKTLCVVLSSDQRFFYWRIFAKFRPEKHGFDLYKGFFMEKKMAQIRQILKLMIPRSPGYMIISRRQPRILKVGLRIGALLTSGWNQFQALWRGSVFEICEAVGLVILHKRAWQNLARGERGRKSKILEYPLQSEWRSQFFSFLNSLFWQNSLVKGKSKDAGPRSSFVAVFFQNMNV